MEDFYCPKCFSKLKRFEGCGAVGYFCDSCKTLISKKKILSHEEAEKRSKKILKKFDKAATLWYSQSVNNKQKSSASHLTAPASDG